MTKTFTRKEALATMTLATAGAIFFGVDSTYAEATVKGVTTHLCLIGDSRTVHMLNWLKKYPVEYKKLQACHAKSGSGFGDWLTDNGRNKHVKKGIVLAPRKGIKKGLRTCEKWIKAADKVANEKNRYVFAMMLGVNDCKSPYIGKGKYDLSQVPDVDEIAEYYAAALKYFADRYHNVEFIFIANPPVSSECNRVAPSTVNRFNKKLKSILPERIRFASPHTSVQKGQRRSLATIVEGSNWRKVMLEDGIHYNEKGCKIIWEGIKKSCGMK